MPAEEESINAILALERLPGSTNKSEHFNYKVEWGMHIDAFKRRLGFSFNVIIST